MGNSHDICTIEPSDIEYKQELKCRDSNNQSELMSSRTIARLNAKALFHYIHPLCSKHEQMYWEETVQAVHHTIDQRGQLKKITEQQNMEKVEPIQKGSSLSLEEIMQIEQRKMANNKIAVNWNSFIKIKKKNYLEDYIFVKEIGRGAYGSVLKIKMKYGGFFRAAKVIKSSVLTLQKTNSEKLFAEISIPIKLDHPNLIKMYQVFQWKQQFILVMELCEGGDLFHNIKKSRFFSEGKACLFIKQILSAVYYLHKQNVCHRDIKPQNILVDHQNENLKIIDFGTAAYFDKSVKLKDLVGTPYYIAPEVLSGSYNEKCDVWSCGVILYILLSGVPPFNGRNQKQIMEKIRIQPLEFNRKKYFIEDSIWGRRKSEAKELVRRMLCKNPDQRISAEQALNSPWIVNMPHYLDKSVINEVQSDVIKNLRSFHFKNKLKAVVYTYIASQLYSNKDKEKLLKVFKEIDKDNDGVIGRDELLDVFNQHSSSSLSPAEIDGILHVIDTNGSGQIDFTQFLVAASNQQKLMEQQRLQNAFNYLDADHSGYITIDEVKAFLDGTEETAEEIKKIFDEVDENGDGQISKKQFISLLLRKD